MGTRPQLNRCGAYCRHDEARNAFAEKATARICDMLAPQIRATPPTKMSPASEPRGPDRLGRGRGTKALCFEREGGLDSCGYDKSSRKVAPSASTRGEVR